MLESFRVVIVAGGLGTRSANPMKPKILQEISPGRTLLDMHLKNLNEAGFKNVTLSLAAYADEVFTELELLKPLYPELAISMELDEQAGGTLGAINQAIRHSNESFYLVILGDIAWNYDLSILLSAFERLENKSLVLVHPNLHPYDSDLVLISPSDDTKILLKGTATSESVRFPTKAIVGMYLFNRNNLLDCLNKMGEITKDLLLPLSGNGKLVTLVTTGYFHDTGTPKRLEDTQSAFRRGVFARRREKPTRAIFLDRDGTIFNDSPLGRTSLNACEIPLELVSSIREVNLVGIPIILVTNQPAIAKGQILIDDFFYTQKLLEETLAQGGAFLDDFEYCPHHPESGHVGEVDYLKVSCDCRKPNIGMFRASQSKHEIDLNNSVYLGDSQIDEEAAKKAGMNFELCSWDGSLGIPTSQAILRWKEILK
jgi:histidinol-phosphate phosphatase family protein